MSLAEMVTAHLPYLRRFARAITGSQKGGDAYVVSTLEAILADPTIFAEDLPPRVALYQTFLRIFNSVSWNNDKTVSAQHPSWRPPGAILKSWLRPPVRLSCWWR